MYICYYYVYSGIFSQGGILFSTLKIKFYYIKFINHYLGTVGTYLDSCKTLVKFLQLNTSLKNLQNFSCCELHWVHL